MKFDSLIKQLSLKKIGHILTLFATLFVLLVAWYSFLKLPNYTWSKSQLLWIVPAFLLYPISLSFMLLGWLKIMRRLGITIDGASNIYLYCINFVTRRLPMGLLWSAGSRITLYSDVGIPAKGLSIAMLWEFLLHTFSAFLIWVIFELLGWGFIKDFVPPEMWWYINLIIGGVAGGGILFFAYRHHSRAESQTNTTPHFSLPFLGKLVCFYALTWLNASVMLWFVSKTIVEIPVSISKLIAIWTFVGGIGGLLAMLPFLNIGAKEISLALLLSQFTSLSQATLIAIIFRLLLTVSDAIWPMSIALCLRTFSKLDGFKKT